MKKILSLVMAAVMCLSCIGLMASCGKEEAKETSSDSEYVTNKGELVVGITDFEPMDYKDKDGNWIGFDADMAKAFAESLGEFSSPVKNKVEQHEKVSVPLRGFIL